MTEGVKSGIPEREDAAPATSWSPEQNLEALSLLRSYCPQAIHAQEFVRWLERLSENHVGPDGERCYRADCSGRIVGFQAARFFRRLEDLLGGVRSQDVDPATEAVAGSACNPPAEGAD